MADSFTEGTIAFLMALPHEAKGVLRPNAWYPIPWPGALAAHRCNKVGALTTLAISGAGRANAQRTVATVLQGPPPEAVISLGFAGGLTHDHLLGDMVIATRLRPIGAQGATHTDPQEAERLAALPTLTPDNALLERMRPHITASGLNVTMGTLLTANAVVATPEEKQRLGAEHGAVAVDMESYWIAEACAEAGVPFLAVRAVVDDSEMQLPPEVINLAMTTGNDAWRLALWALMHPSHIVALRRLGRFAKLAESALSLLVMSVILERAEAAQS